MQHTISERWIERKCIRMRIWAELPRPHALDSGEFWPWLSCFHSEQYCWIFNLYIGRFKTKNHVFYEMKSLVIRKGTYKSKYSNITFTMVRKPTLKYRILLTQWHWYSPISQNMLYSPKPELIHNCCRKYPWASKGYETKECIQ